MLTAQEIDFWDKLIGRSEDLDLARVFYPKAGRPERVKEVFTVAARMSALYPNLLQEKFGQGAYRPELTDHEVQQIAADSLREDIDEGRVGEVFRKLHYSVYRIKPLSEEELTSLVNKALREGGQGYSPGENPRIFAQGLVKFPVMHECPEEVSFTYAVLDDLRYQSLAEPELARNIVTLKVFHSFLLGKFGEAVEIRNKHEQHYDPDLARKLVEDFIDHEALTDYDEDLDFYPLEYLVATQRSPFRELFPADIDQIIGERSREFDAQVALHRADIEDHVKQHMPGVSIGAYLRKTKKDYLAGLKRLALARDIADYLEGINDIFPTSKMDREIAKFGDEQVKQEYAQKRKFLYPETTVPSWDDELNRAFEASDPYSIIEGIKTLTELLRDREYIGRVGESTIREFLRTRITRKITEGDAHVAYAFIFGTNIGHGQRVPPVPNLDQYVDLDKSSLLESMVSAIDWDPEHILSDSYDFGCDGLTINGTSKVDDAYDLYQIVQQEGGRLPSTDVVKKLVFLKMAMHVKDHYEGRGMRVVVDVFENPANSEFVDQGETKRLLTKVFTDYFEKGRVDGLIGAESVPYFYTLVSSKLGSLVQDDQRLVPYVKLHNFLQAE